MLQLKHRVLVAEGVGTALLVAVVVGSGIAAQRLNPRDTGLQLLENALATGAALVALILTFGSVSSQFNPVVTLVERVRGRLSTGDAVARAAVQVAGGVVGTIVANLMFGLPVVELSTHTRSAGSLWFAEVVATFGLVVVIGGTARRLEHVAVAVGGYITAAYFFTASTSFANPAVTIARMFSDTFAGIRPSSVPVFVVCQVVGAVLGAAVVATVFVDEPVKERV